MFVAIGLLALILASSPTLINPGFEDGLTGWKVQGDIRLETTNPIKGHGSVEIGPKGGSVSQSYKAPGLRILWFGATLKPSGKGDNGRVRLQCVDRKGQVVLDRTGEFDPKNGAGVYLKTQAFTDHVVVSIEKGPGGTLLADDALLTDDDKDRIEHAPEVNLDEAMLPIWEGHRVLNESVLLLSKHGDAASGRLLFNPSKIIEIRDSELRKEYRLGKDAVLDGQTLTAASGASIPTMSDQEFVTGEFPWTRFDGRHIFVTYEHEDSWQGPIPTYQGDRLPRTVRLLKERKPLTVVAYGDSITLGINGSYIRNVPPYQPPWPFLFVHEVSKLSHDAKIKLYNTALGGMTSEWAKDNATDVVASLKPDLVIIAFGMNDFWSLTPKQFAANIAETMLAIRTRRPSCEFILVASMKFDPDYTRDPTYVGNLAGYPAALQKLTGTGVALFDMTSLSDALYHLKSSKDLTTDPMHPDDFLARGYAQGMVQTLLGYRAP